MIVKGIGTLIREMAQRMMARTLSSACNLLGLELDRSPINEVRFIEIQSRYPRTRKLQGAWHRRARSAESGGKREEGEIPTMAGFAYPPAQIDVLACDRRCFDCVSMTSRGSRPVSHCGPGHH